ncbi:hypothetical protein MGWOODY_Hyp1829 [hydrothermal vent metagenome]|uniref:Uncharacterized protein n=1 Tax=hydrothermal vent metagenome TaxID=652676 RepID=A0A160U553_9ZZZZ
MRQKIRGQMSKRGQGRPGKGWKREKAGIASPAYLRSVSDEFERHEPAWTGG